VRVISILVGLFTAIYVRDVFLRLHGPPAPALAPEQSVPDLVPILETRDQGQGLACLPGCLASAYGLRAFDRSCTSRDGPYRCGRMTASRRLLVGGAIDLRSAGVDELEALPGIGPRLAQAIRQARPSSLAELTAVRGIGQKRAAVLAHAVGLDARRMADICSMGLWPTISSGCGRPR
jgi:Helix-hairpin-helix motif